jgi:thioredoxin 1
MQLTMDKRKTFAELIAAEPLVLVDFTAAWCGPCKMMKPILDEVKSAIGDQAKIIKVDVDKNNAAASHYQISGVPTLILFKHGKIVWRQSGVVQPAALKQVIQANA